MWLAGGMRWSGVERSWNRSGVGWGVVKWSGVECACTIKYIHPVARVPKSIMAAARFFLLQGQYPVPIQRSSANPRDVLLPKWGTPYSTPRPPKMEHKQRKRTVSSPLFSPFLLIPTPFFPPRPSAQPSILEEGQDRSRCPFDIEHESFPGRRWVFPLAKGADVFPHVSDRRLRQRRR